ncbi:hypothetical protein EDEG_02486 [Edhazardia aedis USNM 41457]|uniref:Uncharacterized protein n=1 Tax=Edhazardia aedis (strain USNM 41457) TaxID=1003232 RepID=J9D6J5_EDHAE|nr:hypothetical protein EDEG_02486 [Edhazardia aedis USNM 41457]|eukprot:EJW03134.1 hypothetical protein EDEG_02486 [Edhazardia aedis USNM 41457]
MSTNINDEISILKILFTETLEIKNNFLIIETQYGTLEFNTERYPENIPHINLTITDENKTQDFKRKLTAFALHLKEKGIKFMIYTIVYFFIHKLNKIDVQKDDSAYLQDFEEITEEMFYKWRSTRVKNNSDNNIFTGKKYFQSIAKNPSQILE